MKTDNKIREGFHSIEILLKNKPEVIKKVNVPCLLYTSPSPRD